MRVNALTRRQDDTVSSKRSIDRSASLGLVQLDWLRNECSDFLNENLNGELYDLRFFRLVKLCP